MAVILNANNNRDMIAQMLKMKYLRVLKKYIVEILYMKAFKMNNVMMEIEIRVMDAIRIV